MKVTGIIAEYNPFHRGHKYQIDYCKKELGADYVIVAMSGDYVQRGTPALLSKHVRAEMALRCGADLVLEMPVSVSTASAEAFAMGGVSMLDGLHVVDKLCFGSEYGDVSALQELAEILVKEPEEYRRLLKEFLGKGDKVLLIDDFLANGKALEGLATLVQDSGAELVGAGVVIEKGFQIGGKLLRDRGIHLESLAIVDGMDDKTGEITFRKQ